MSGHCTTMNSDIDDGQRLSDVQQLIGAPKDANAGFIKDRKIYDSQRQHLGEDRAPLGRASTALRKGEGCHGMDAILRHE